LVLHFDLSSEDVMLNLIKRYTHWLHGQWPAGRVERLPELADDGGTNVPGIYVVGDLKGVPLLKFSIDSGTKAVRTITADKGFQSLKSANEPGVLDLVIIGGGLSGVAAALEARKMDLNHVLLEASETLSTIVNFPKAKPIFTYPKDMTPEGDLRVSAPVKEALLEEIRGQVDGKISPRKSFAERIEKIGKIFNVVLRDEEPIKARRVIVAIGRSGNFRKLGVAGEELNKVYNRLHDPADYKGKRCLVVGGGDSAMETAIALTQSGADVTMSYRKKEFARAKPENIEMVQRLAKNPADRVHMMEPTSERVSTASGDFMGDKLQPGHLRLLMGSAVKRITEADALVKKDDGAEETLPNDVVFAMIGREAPLNIFRRSGIRITNDHNPGWIATLVVSLLLFTFIYHWKKTGIGGFDHIPVARAIVHVGDTWAQKGWFPYHVTSNWTGTSALAQTLKISLTEPGFY
jgi:thioredoxin reductase